MPRTTTTADAYQAKTGPILFIFFVARGAALF